MSKNVIRQYEPVMMRQLMELSAICMIMEVQNERDLLLKHIRTIFKVPNHNKVEGGKL